MSLSSIGITQLTLTNFRSYPQARLICDTRPVIITGDNGAGKTNILEAISFLNPGKGLRNAKLSDCLYHNHRDQDLSDTWGVAAIINHTDSPFEIGTSFRVSSIETETKRLVQFQNAPCSQSDLLNYIRLIWLTPQMDRMFIDGTSVRRKFLDRLVYLTDPLHASRVLKYEYVVRERLKLLKNGWIAEGVWLDKIEQQMAELTIAIIDARQQTILRLMQAENWAIGLFPKAHLRLVGETEQWLEKFSFLEAEDKLRLQLKIQRESDQQSGRTLTGAHKSQFEVIYSEKNQLAELCSTGEQKALLLSIVMAACRLQALRHEGAPIVLLDEVVAHLDQDRRQQLFNEIVDLKLQVWITGTDQEIFSSFKDKAQHFKIAENVIARYNCK